MLADVVLFLDRGNCRVRIRRADHAEFVRVRAQLLLHRKAITQRLARIFGAQHVVGLDDRQIQITQGQCFEVGKLIVR